MSKMNPEIKALWIDALRGEGYKQGHGLLNDGGYFCCLGVLCDIAVKQGVGVETREHDEMTYYDDRHVFLPDAVMEWAGLDSENGMLPESAKGEGGNLAALNDSGRSFSEIADTIEKYF